MKCEKCKKFNATTHIHTVINGSVTDMKLCGYCASAAGLNRFDKLGMMSALASVFDDSTLNPSKNLQDELACPFCGATFADIAEGGLVGCAECYQTFFKQLTPTLKSLHGKTHHCGKIPRSAAPRLGEISPLEGLEARLRNAIENENFELAAALRDEIKALKENLDG